MSQFLTLADQIRETLAEQIVSGELAPGTRLDEVEIAKRVGLSRTPVREAFKALTAMGFLEHRPRKGVVVAVPDRQRIEEMFEVMAEVEATCARFAALRMTAKERRELESLHEQSLRMVRQSDLAGYSSFNTAFHALIYKGSKNSFLEETAQSVRRRLMPYRQSQFRVIGRLSSSHAEHDEVVNAILRGDGDAAEKAMRQHVSRVTVASVDFVEERRSKKAALSAPPDDRPASLRMR
ncbi:GntR family transcriptional regulator [Ferrovibrio sp.]|uniref:GntR family transcriptional regulator n=1 Tax=Ferrovibrio sp. TaxID=1917215 RepID=UPI002601B911|nr:GntR family transcriptional regulator [Ferrovibrio sp.]